MVRAVHKLFKLANNPITRLPKPYLDYFEKSKEPAERVHDAPPETKYLDYDQDEQSGYVYRVPDQPIPVTFPPQSQSELWGNCGCVVGFEKPKRLKPRIARIWFPTREKHTLYSDILDTYINIVVTPRTLQLINDAKGFDFYLLNTRAQDLQSELGRRLKYKVHLALCSDNLSEYILQKYKDHIKPKEEVEWQNLAVHEALTKQKLEDQTQIIEPPLKQTYIKAMIDDMKKEKQPSID